MIAHLSRRLARRIAPLLAIGAFAACSDSSSEPSGTLTATQKAKIAAVLSNPAVAVAFFGDSEASTYGNLFLPLIATNLQSTGTVSFSASSSSSLSANMIPGGISADIAPVGTYHTFSGQAVITAITSDEEEIHLVWTGVIGVDDLDNPDKLFLMGALDMNTSTAPTSIPLTSVGTVGNRTITAAFVDLNGDDDATVYSATSGQFELTSASFSGSANCSGVALIFVITECTRGTGTAAGSFAFSGLQINGSETVTVPSTSFNLPGIRMTMTVDVSNF